MPEPELEFDVEIWRDPKTQEPKVSVSLYRWRVLVGDPRPTGLIARWEFTDAEAVAFLGSQPISPVVRDWLSDRSIDLPVADGEEFGTRRLADWLEADKRHYPSP